MKHLKSLLVLFFFIIQINEAHCTHGIALEMRYQRIGLNEYQIEIWSYNKYRTGFDPDTLTVFWGDGTDSVIDGWVNGPIDINTGKHVGEFVGLLRDSIKLNIYRAKHIYSGPSNYILMVELKDRIHTICNINKGDSRQISTIIFDTIFIQDISIFGKNQGPVFLNPPILYANGGDTFVYNPLAVDLEGDSISYELIVPMGRKDGVPVGNVSQYIFPDQYNPNPNNKFSLNQKTGEIKWIVPPISTCNCPISIAVRVNEYRKGVKLSTMIRDMQILVYECIPNNPPQIIKPNDTCIKAGEPFQLVLKAFDLDSLSGKRRDSVYFYALGAPFIFSSPTAIIDSPAVGNPVSANFSWTPSCDFIRKNPYEVLLKAHDNFILNGKTKYLYDEELWKIKVIAPEPKNLVGTVVNRKIVLNWKNPYYCFGSKEFDGFSVWRKNGCDSFVPDNCETGLSQRGYVQIASKINAYTYTDNTAKTGQKYSYRILANFSKKGEGGGQIIEESLSPPSNEVCIELSLDIPVLINVDVTETDKTNGKIFVRWVKPKTNSGNLDTLLHPGPYQFKVYHSEGQTGTNFTLFKTISSLTFSGLNDTFFEENLLNTEEKSHSYKIAFYANNNDSIGESDIASSVFLSSTSKHQSLGLNWTENVPWNNYEYDVNRRDFNSSNIFKYIKTVVVKNFNDSLLINDSLYCYYVLAKGTYNSPHFSAPFVNRSQIRCDKPQDKIPPCPPTIVVSNDCNQYFNSAWKNEQYINYVNWEVKGGDTCKEGIVSYQLYYAPDSSTNYSLIKEFSAFEFNYNHALKLEIKGCYKITATDLAGNISKYSNIFCVDNCPFYNLPNTFTPNGDGDNDLFTPFKPYRFVSRIDMKIYNRWGNLVYETKDPEILWNGKDDFSNKELSEGVYMYSGNYYINTLGGEIMKPLPGSKNGGGYIHLFKGK